MADAVTARRDGDTFQARQFWRKACLLLDSESPLVRVGFESGPKGFDDIWVEYAPSRGLQDQEGLPLLREHIQCKWHVAPSTYGHAEFVDPEFINANAKSLLQRAHAAQRDHAPEGKGARFRLLTNWRISREDPLGQLVHQRSNTLRLNRLFGTATDKSAMGAVRKLWREHLELSEDELRLFLRTLAVSEATDSLDQLRHDLDPLLRIAGLRRVAAHESAFIYDEVIYQWMAQGRLVFDRDTLRSSCEREGLMADPPEPRPRVYGVKSFEHATDRLEDRCTEVLNLVPSFLDRQIRPEADWQTSLYPALKNFLLQAASTGERIRLIIDAHLTLGFAAGTILNMKSGRILEIEQRTLGKAVWSPDDLPHDAAWPQWKFDEEFVAAGSGDLAVAISLTHDTSAKVRNYVQAAIPQAGRILHATLSSGQGSRGVVCGRHAFALAESLAGHVKALREQNKFTKTHLFIAGPGGFAVYFGQRQPSMGPLTLYEFDFEGTHGGSYEPALSFPVT
jgi:SMODS-associated and fused to various effectors sensor domain